MPKITAIPLVDLDRLHAMGLHLYPVGPTKKPQGRWRRGGVDYVEVQPTIEQLHAWNKRAVGWALLAGGPAALVCLDVEAEGMRRPEITWVLEGLPESCERRSPSGGRHAWVQIVDAPAPATEKLAIDGDGVLLAEIRGHGGYAVLLGHGRGELPADWAPHRMTLAEFDVLLKPIRALNEHVDPPQPRLAATGVRDESSPSDTADVLHRSIVEQPEQIVQWLDPGWQCNGYDREGRLILMRPDYGSPTDTEASANLLDGVLVVWSSSVPWAVPGRPYSAAAAFAASCHGSDFAAAMTAVEERLGIDSPLDPGGTLVDLSTWKTQQPLTMETEPWGDPVSPLASASTICLDGLPELLRNVIHEVSRQAQAPPEIALNAVFGALSAACRGAWDVRVHEGWNAGPVVWWGCALASSGERKDAATKPIMASLIHVERELARAQHKVRERAMVKHKSLLADAEAARKAGDYMVAGDLADQAAREAPRAELGLLLSDSTTEALGMHLTEQRGAVAIISTEASSLRTVAGAYSDAGANTGLLNAAYDGEQYRDRRIKREGINVHRPTLTWCTAVQPEIMAGYAGTDTEGSGFLARFAYFVPESMVGKRERHPKPADPFVLGAWATTLAALHAFAWSKFESMTEDALLPGNPTVLPLDAAGRELILDEHDRLEARKTSDGDLRGLGGWIEKHLARIVRLAALLALHEDPQTSFVEEAHVRAALTLSEPLIQHGATSLEMLRGLHGASEEDVVLEALRKVQRETDGTVTTRNVHRALHGRAWVTSADDVRNVLERLASMGWVRKDAVHGTGRPKEVWHLHPTLGGGS